MVLIAKKSFSVHRLRRLTQIKFKRINADDLLKDYSFVLEAFASEVK